MSICKNKQIIRPLAYSSPPTYREKNTSSVCFLLREKGVGLVVGGAYVSFLFPWKYTPWTFGQRGTIVKGLFGLEELWRNFGVYCSSGNEALRAFGTRENKIPFRRKGCELCAFWRKKSIHLKSMEIWRLACPLCLSSRGCSRLPVSLSSLSIPVFQTA